MSFKSIYRGTWTKNLTHPVCLTVGGFLEGVGSTEGEVLKRLMYVRLPSMETKCCPASAVVMTETSPEPAPPTCTPSMSTGRGKQIRLMGGWCWRCIWIQKLRIGSLNECESTLESDIRLCYYLKSKKDGWVKSVGIFWLNSKIPSADWPFEYTRDPCLIMRPTRDGEETRLPESLYYLILKTSTRQLTQPQPYNRFGWSWLLDSNYVA